MGIDKIHIEDLMLLKITKVTTWKIYFQYSNKSYMLIDDSEEDAHISLYEREISNNKIRLHFLNGAITLGGTNLFIKDVSKKKAKHLVYSNIDREYFVKKLIHLGFSSGLYEQEYIEMKNRRTGIISKIKELTKESESLSINYYKTSGHGSKSYGDRYKKTKV